MIMKESVSDRSFAGGFLLYALTFSSVHDMMEVEYGRCSAEQQI